MLLEFGIGDRCKRRFHGDRHNFVDRTGVVHPDAGSGIAYTPPIGDERDKWEIDYVVKVVPGKTLLETPEEFLYWRAKNREPRFLHGAIAISLARFPSGVCSQACACSI